MSRRYTAQDLELLEKQQPVKDINCSPSWRVLANVSNVSLLNDKEQKLLNTFQEKFKLYCQEQDNRHAINELIKRHTSPDSRYYNLLEEKATEARELEKKYFIELRSLAETNELKRVVNLVESGVINNTAHQESQSKEEARCRRKEWWKEHTWWIYLIPLALIVLFVIGVNAWGIYNVFRKLWVFSNENIGLLILNIFSIPFAIFGGINIFRGWFMMMEKDGEKFGFYKDWHASVYLLITFISFVAFVYWMIRY